MRFFILMCCTAHLLTEISSRIRRTTPISSALRSNDAEARLVMKFAKMIDFVNSASNNDDRTSSFRTHGPSKRKDSRRVNEMMDAMYGFADIKKSYNTDTQAVMQEIEDKVRYYIIDNPDVVMEERANKQNKAMDVTMDQETVPFDAYKYSTAKNKPLKFKLDENATAHLRAQEDVQELITDKNTYRPSFPDDEDDDKPITGGIELINNEKENNKPNLYVEDPAIPPETEIYKLDEFEKKTQNNIPSRKVGKAQIDKKKADTNDSKETGTKKEDNKKYISTKFIHSQEKLNEDSIRPKDDDDDINKEDGDTNENSGTNETQKETSWGDNVNNLTSVERLMFKAENKINDKRDHMEQYSHKQRRENSNKYSVKSHEKKDRYDKRKIDEYHDKRGERESQWIKVDNQKDYKGSLRDKNDDKWSRKERDWDSNRDKWNKKEKGLDSNYDKGIKTENKWDNDDRWSKKENIRDKTVERGTKGKYWNNKKRDHDKDEVIDTMELEWNKRHKAYDKHEDDAQWEYSDNQKNEKNFKERDNDYKNRDSEFNKRDYDWTKRESGGNKNIGRTYDRNESGNKKSYESVDNDGDVRHERYKIVDRVVSDSSRHDDYERFH